MSGHTPGPWYVVGGRDAEIFNARFVIVSEHVDDAIVASLGGDVPEEEANARLIAAAPDLLEALREVADRLAIHVEHTEDLIAHMKAHKAIAKAEGK